MKQTLKLKNSGSVFNFLMSNNSTIPVVGEWATICLYSDRHVAKVVEVSKDCKKIVIEDYTTIGVGENLQMGHQSWEHSPSGYTRNLVYRQGAWREVIQDIVFDDVWYKKYQESGQRFDKFIEPIESQLWDENGCLRLLDGVSKIKTQYKKINIIFGVCNYHYDWEF